MPERDATLVRADLARAAGRNDEYSRVLENLLARYPDTETAWLKLGFWAFASNLPHALESSSAPPWRCPIPPAS